MQTIRRTTLLTTTSLLTLFAAVALTPVARTTTLSTSRSTTAVLRLLRLRKYFRPKLLCIDELGYLSYDENAADLLFHVVNPRYDARRSIVLTTNLAFKDWNTVFPNATCIATLLDRLTHHADVTVLEGKSYRVRESEQENDERKQRRRQKKDPA